MKAEGINIIPTPVSVLVENGEFFTDENCQIAVDPHMTEEDMFTVGILAEQFHELLGININIISDCKGNTKPIRLRRITPDYASELLAKSRDSMECKKFIAEGYRLHVCEDAVEVAAVSSEGLFYAVQTLIQLLRCGRKVRCCDIIDYPALNLRGAFMIFAPDLRWYTGSQTPTLDYLKSVLRTLSEYKINTLVIEYGDKFPYRSHPALNHKDAFSIEEIREFLKYAEKLHIQIIPLLQCLGHLDYILVHKEYAHLKEGGKEGRQVCPLNPKSFELFVALAEELIAAHPRSEYFHVGGDETRELGDCPLCREEARNGGKGSLYLNYVNRICAWVKQHGKTPIIWDDMLCVHPEIIDRFDRDVVLMYWDYATALEKNPMLIARPPINGYETVYDRSWDNIDRGEFTDLQKIVFQMRETGGINMRELDEKFFSTYGAYFGEEFPEYIRPFPYLEFYMDRGFKVIGAPSVHGCAGGYIMPDPLLATANINLLGRRMSERNGEGMVATWWTAVAIPFEMCWYAWIVAANSAWSSEPFSRDSFDARFCRQFFGVENTDIAAAVFLLNGERIPYAQSYFRNVSGLAEEIKQFEESPQISIELDRLKALSEKALLALTLLLRNSNNVRYHKLAFLHLCLAARTVIHKVKQVSVFHAVKSMRDSCEDIAALKPGLQELKQELIATRDEIAKTFGMSVKPLEVKEELTLRFGNEENLINEYLK